MRVDLMRMPMRVDLNMEWAKNTALQMMVQNRAIQSTKPCHSLPAARVDRCFINSLQHTAILTYPQPTSCLTIAILLTLHTPHIAFTNPFLHT